MQSYFIRTAISARPDSSGNAALTTADQTFLSCTIEQHLLSCPMTKKKKIRTVIFYKDYFQSFFESLRDKVKDKIIWTLDLIEEIQKIPETYLKYIENTDGLYEIRIQQGSDIFRIFCFFDEGQIVVLMNGFQKKTRKTQKKEIDRALLIKREYENNKK
jgi:phage-related protein